MFEDKKYELRFIHFYKILDHRHKDFASRQSFLWFTEVTDRTLFWYFCPLFGCFSPSLIVDLMCWWCYMHEIIRGGCHLVEYLVFGKVWSRFVVSSIELGSVVLSVLFGWIISCTSVVSSIVLAMLECFQMFFYLFFVMLLEYQHN